MTYQNATDDKYRETAKLEKARVKAYQRQQVRGTLNPAVPLPFKGQSTAQKEFINRKKERVEKVLPFNMVSAFCLLSLNKRKSYAFVWNIFLTVGLVCVIFHSW